MFLGNSDQIYVNHDLQFAILLIDGFERFANNCSSEGSLKLSQIIIFIIVMESSVTFDLLLQL